MDKWKDGKLQISIIEIEEQVIKEVKSLFHKHYGGKNYPLINEKDVVLFLKKGLILFENKLIKYKKFSVTNSSDELKEMKT